MRDRRRNEPSAGSCSRSHLAYGNSSAIAFGEDGAHRERIRELCQNDGVLLRLLRSSYSEQRSQTVGDLAVRSTPALYWPGLAEMVGDEERLRQRVTEIAGRVDRAQLDERTRLALETAERYVSGELPLRDDRL